MPNLMPTVSDDDAMTGFRAFLLALFPEIAPASIQQDQQNNVSMPPLGNFIMFSPSGRGMLSTTVRDYDPTDALRRTTRSTQVDLQVNFYGPDSTDLAQTFATLFRDLYGCDFLAPYGLQPLFCDDGRQMPLVDGEQHFEARWLVQASMQINPVVSTSQDFADNVTVKLVEAD